MAVTTEDIRMYTQTFADMTEGEFVDFLNGLKEKEEERKAEEERKKRMEAQRKADEERRQALLPDRNKILEAIAKIDWDRPEVTTEEGKQFAGELFDALHKFKQAWSEKADQVL